MHAFDTPGKTRLRVKNAAGLVSVEASETGQTTVELEALRDDDATREAIERATVELNGNEVLVEIGVGGKGFGVGPAWISFGRTPQVGVRIRCPEGADLDCTTASADVAATGRLGEVEVKTASGDVAVEHVAGLRVQSASGDVRGSDGRRRSAAADRLRRRPPRHGRRPGRGDARLGRLRDRRGAAPTWRPRPSPATSGSAPSVRGRSSSSRSRATCGSASGPARALHIDANSTSGDVSSELDVKDRPSEAPSGSEARLQIKTVSGDVEITRAAAVSA